MRRAAMPAALVTGLALLVALAGPAGAASPELVSRPFEVKVSGGVVEMTFTLTLSEVSTYPTKITAMRGSEEEVLYEGTLAEGVYRFSAPLTKITGRGDLKVVLRTKVTNRTDRGNDSFLVYQAWTGSL